MKVRTPDGREIVVRRRWLPWLARFRGPEKVPSMDGDLDTPIIGWVFGAIALLSLSIWLVAIGILLVELALLVVIVSFLFLARFVGLRPWEVQATGEGRVLGIRRVRGWTASSEAIREIAGAYEHGDRDPFGSASRGT